ncbi:putative RNA helicase [Cavenderia fasciculata]|uniref:RNA helicase n=1 Tax=Cavenderia fasciculata TaxID=261658 RepID=F4QCG4_CACFS|nr:putative RNA helicase [Cavenderia fasciculata]EGG13599.1 putative RNA helicase [Cavenderia fasciculata]|eukprot:XP_004350303.1 putative RNA helicase [Cavenderia fasciculata]
MNISDTAKNSLQEYCQKNKLTLPTYDVTTTCQDHAKKFMCKVKVQGHQYNSLWMDNKKDAEKHAATVALVELSKGGHKRLMAPPPRNLSPSHDNQLAVVTKNMDTLNINLNHGHNRNYGLEVDPIYDIKLNQTTGLFDYGKIEFYSPLKQSIVDIEVADDAMFKTKDKMREHLDEKMKATLAVELLQLTENPIERIPLVTQQTKVIKDETGLDVIGLHGDSNSTILDSKHDVLVIIGALFINLIQKDHLNLSDYCIIVVDEAHHIVKDHPFAVLLREYYTKLGKSLQPRIMGLTASPAGKADFFSTLLSLKVMSRVSQCRIVTPLPHSVQEIKKHQNQKDMRIEELSVNKNEQFLITLISRLTQWVKDRFQVKINVPAGLEELFNAGKADQYENQDIDPEEPDTDDYTISTTSSSSKGGLNANLTQIVNLFVAKCIEFLKYGSHMDKEMPPNIKEYCIRLAEKAKFLTPEVKKEVVLQIQSITHSSDNENSTNICKLDKALEILEEHNALHQADPSKDQFRAILFVKTRDSAHQLGEILNNISNKSTRYSFTKCVTVVGHGSNTDGGMSTSKQKEVVEAFRTGKANVVVTTNVLEEGLDVPECNLVIRIDAPSTVTALIQSRGRARHRNSEFVAIIKTIEGHSYRRFLMHEQLLQETIEFLRTGVIPESLSHSIDNTYYYKKELEEIVQKCKSADFDLGFQIKTFSIGNVNSPKFQSILSLATANYQESATAPSKKESREAVCRQVMESFTIYKIIASMN